MSSLSSPLTDCFDLTPISSSASPYFMKRILVALSDPTGEALSSGFVFSTLAFISTLVKAQSDVNHLWLSRRAGVRVKSELHSALYEKALKRRDASGVGEGKGVAGVGKIIKCVGGFLPLLSVCSDQFILYPSFPV